MKQLSLLLLLLLPIFSTAQSCNCTTAQVESNTVTPCDITIGEIITVSTTQQLRDAIIQANNGGNLTVLIEDGTYPIASTSWYPYITGSNLVFRSLSGNRDAVVLTGQGMQDVAPGTEIVMSLVGDNITVADLTIRDCGNHGISTNSDDHLIHNVRIQNTYEQMIKGTSGGDNRSEDCVVQCSLFEYTAGVGPQWYIGGLDIHEGDTWEVRDNVFRNIASPSQTLAEHAVHFWDDSRFNLVERNKIVNCDRGIGFGLGSSPNLGGVIRNNMIYNDGTSQFHDVGIGLESSPYTHVYNNTIHIQYPNAIEYRFQSTHTTRISNNLVNQAIRSRNGGEAILTTNLEELEDDWFVDYANGDLHLSGEIDGVVDAGTTLAASLLSDDYDQEERMDAVDIGADEYSEEIVLVDLDMDGYTNDVDCNDMDASINPDAIEIPNNDIDENCDQLVLIIDEDMDGFNSDEDCDDSDASINPDAQEIPNNDIDENCDDLVLIIDEDMDGFNSDEDCDDSDASINPDAQEIPNNDIDENCDDLVLIIDEDMDGFNSDEDCDDTDASINPDAIEIPNNDIDEDCDGEDLVTSIKELKKDLYSIYPNPASTIINIETHFLDMFSIQLKDITGDVVISTINSNSIDVSTLQPGFYFVVLTNQKLNQHSISKIIIE